MVGLRILIGICLLCSSAIFGFFYAWVCSTMWGLDKADPRVAIAAMQAMNASVRNAYFAPAFFGTPMVLLAAAFSSYRVRRKQVSLAMIAAALTYIIGAFMPTMQINVPMNEALAATHIPTTTEEARLIWNHYSPTWQFWNQLRAMASGLALLFVGWGLHELGKSV